MSIKDIIAQHEGDIVITNELLTNDECLRKPFRLGLHGVAEHQTQLGAITQQAFKCR